METASVGVAVAFLAGLLSFLSPCVLPLIPSYATFLTGMSLSELTDAEQPRGPVRRALLVHGGLFVAGFTLVFIALGASATYIGGLLFYYSTWIERIGGGLLVLFGLFLLGVIRLPGASREWRVHLGNKPAGYVGTLVVGIAFGAGWTPCVGPVLGAILTLASTMDSVQQGVVLLGSYSAGLAVPFVLATLALDRFLAGFRSFRRWLPWVSRASGVLLIVVGVLLLTGSFTVLAGMLARWTPEFLWERL
ncbi:MAG TPA: cytochrome c biogenesis protein CcdA [Longimicrobiales bacterium]|nr:cytochrome c biogenesis protein CcdA [Longimicrobiales bacterium]